MNFSMGVFEPCFFFVRYIIGYLTKMSFPKIFLPKKLPSYLETDFVISPRLGLMTKSVFIKTALAIIYFNIVLQANSNGDNGFGDDDNDFAFFC